MWQGEYFLQCIDSLGSNRIVSDVAIRAEKLLEYSRWLNEKSSLFLDTGEPTAVLLLMGSGVLLSMRMLVGIMPWTRS